MPRPQSDVSQAVGLVGLLGLFVWIVICRNWPEITAALGFAGQTERFAGPTPSLIALLFSGGAMVAWSVFVDKVHLRPSTGIDWKNPHPRGSTLDVSITKIAGLWATWAIIAFLYCIARWYWRGPYLFAMEVLAMAAVPLVVLSVPYVIWLDRYLVNPRDGAWHFGAMLIGREAYDFERVKAHARSWTVKGFFCAFMFSILPPGFSYIVQRDFSGVLTDPVQFWGALIELMFVVDVQIAMVGYLLTMKPLDAQIRSANPHLAGWVAALICYPPFILMTDGGPLNYHPHTAEWSYWFDGQTALLWVWGAWLTFLTGVYAWATVIFGIRFSNLTYRGVITNGPYAFTRHPAYLAKNTFWWCATLPFLATSSSLTDMVRNTVILAMVSGVYFWRAKTEEMHLLAEDAKYREYHAWMAENAFITRSLGKLLHLFRPRGPRLQPAE